MECSTPKCPNEPLKDSKFCKPCGENLARIREEFEKDPKSLYNQRSDNPNRKMTNGKTKRGLPTCCMPGCYELRIPPEPYCSGHEGYGETE